ncbi:hypothetical protein ACJX0J_009754, partial [Zea mays]
GGAHFFFLKKFPCVLGISKKVKSAFHVTNLVNLYMIEAHSSRIRVFGEADPLLAGALKEIRSDSNSGKPNYLKLASTAALLFHFPTDVESTQAAINLLNKFYFTIPDIHVEV